MITLFRNIWDTKNPVYIEPEVMFDRIKTGKYAELVSKIRAEENKNQRNELKKGLPCIIWAGRFSERLDKSIAEHSGLVVIDFDHLPDVEGKKAEISKNEFVRACFVSPSGDGLKAVIRVPKDADNHRLHYKALLKKFPELDATSINESRVCYESSDPNIYLNPDAVEFTEIEKEVEKTYQPPNVATKPQGTDYRKVNTAAEMIRNAPDGDKHKALLKASKLMGGYIAGGLVDEFQAIQILEAEISNRDIGDFRGAQKTIRDGISYGKTQPINEIEKEVIVKSANTGIKNTDAIWEEMKHGFVHGKKRGETTHLKNLDKHFTWKAGDLTLVIGRPNAGKSEFCYHLMLLKAVMDGWKWAIFSPENYPDSEFFDTMIHSYVGKTVDPIYENRQMTMTEYRRGYEFVREHFFYVYPQEHTMPEIQKNFMYLVEEEKINGTLLDPFNQIECDYGARDDQFLSTFLTERKRFSIEHNLHNVITAHPRTMHRNKDGEYEVPDMYDIAMGAMWANKVDNIMAVHRPNLVSDPLDKIVEIHVRKIKKQKLVGIPGTATLWFDRETNRYNEATGSPLGTKVIDLKQQSVIDYTVPQVEYKLAANAHFENEKPKPDPNAFGEDAPF